MLEGIQPDRLLMLVRHAESEKNIQDYHGHSKLDHPLTAAGLSSAREFGRQLKGKIDLIEVITSGSRSARDTGAAIAESLQCGVQVRESLHAVGMGIIAGLTDSEVKARFPRIHQQLRDFQEGRLHPKDLEIPGREGFMEFACRIRSELDYIISRPRPLMVIAHHSTLNMLMHVATVRSNGSENAPYQRYKFPNLSVSLIEIGDDAKVDVGIRAVASQPVL